MLKTNYGGTKELINVLKCALADLQGAQQAREQGDIEGHNWKAHALSIREVEEVLTKFDKV